MSTFCGDADAGGECRHVLDLIGGGSIYYWANFPLVPEPGENGCHVTIERLVIVQHGNGRTPWSYFDSIQDAADLAGVTEQTLIIAPYFPAEEDAPPAGFHRWAPGGSGWRSGDHSETIPEVSAFTVYDEILLEHMADKQRFPALSEVVITGHSAGGQFVQRYAVSSTAEQHPSLSDLDVRYLVLNPSSWLYLDGYRWDGEGTPPDISFALPAGTDCDASYNDYKYGLSDIPVGHYVKAHLATIPSTFLARDVTFLLGEADVEAYTGLDTSCPAQLQGQHRYERGQVYASYLNSRYPNQTHTLVTVPGVGHSKSGMYESEVGVAQLFPN